MSTVALNGTSLYYVVKGDGPPCLVLHGGLGVDHQVYRRTLAPLAEAATGSSSTIAPPPAAFVELVSTVPASDAKLDRALRRLLPYYLPSSDPAAVAELFAGTIVSASAMGRGFEVLAGWSSVDCLGTISCPVRVSAGRLDLFSAPPQAYRIADRVSDAEVVIFEESGHFPWIEEPERFFPTMKGWWHEPDGSAGGAQRAVAVGFQRPAGAVRQLHPEAVARAVEHRGPLPSRWRSCAATVSPST